MIRCALTLITCIACNNEALLIDLKKSPFHALKKGKNESVTLTWDASGVEEATKYEMVTLNTGFRSVVGKTGSKTFTPPDSTEYELQVTKKDGNVIKRKIGVHVLDENGDIEITRISFPREAQWSDNFVFTYNFKQTFGTLFSMLSLSAYDVDKPEFFLTGADLNPVNDVDPTFGLKGTLFTEQWPMKAGPQHRKLGFTYCDPFSDNCIFRLAKGVTADYKLLSRVHKIYFYNTYDQAGNATNVSVETMREMVGMKIFEYLRQKNDPLGRYGNVDDIFSNCVAEHGGGAPQFIFGGSVTVQLPGTCTKPFLADPSGTWDDSIPNSSCELALGEAGFFFQFKITENNIVGYQTNNGEGYSFMLRQHAGKFMEKTDDEVNDALHVFFVNDPYFGRNVDSQIFEYYDGQFIDFATYIDPPKKNNLLIINANSINKRPQYLDKLVAGLIVDPLLFPALEETCTNGDRFDSVLCKDFGHSIVSEKSCNLLHNTPLYSEAYFKTAKDGFQYTELKDFNH